MVGRPGPRGGAGRPARRPSRRSTTATWSRAGRALRLRGSTCDGFAAGFANGRAFLEADDALAGRIPRRIEWTGGHRLPGDEAVPLDLRIDHVYLVSCKYLSKVLQNASPARLAEGLLTFRHLDDRRDWYERVAPVEYQALYRACGRGRWAPGTSPPGVTDLDVADRERLSPLLDGRTVAGGHPGRVPRILPGGQHRDGADLEALPPPLRSGGDAVAAAPDRIGPVLRARQRRSGLHAAARRHPVGLAPALPPGDASRSRPRSSASPGSAGRPAVLDHRHGGRREVRGHVQIRWSHGRFRQRPEAKVYLDTPHAEVPGYHPL